MAIDTKLPIGRALQDGDWAYIQSRINNRWGCNVTLSETRKTFSVERETFLDDNDIGQGWTDSTWLMWIKNRVRFRCGESAQEQTKWNELHFFFIGIPEDMSMLGKLEADAWFPEDTTVRSRISGSQLSELNPINRTAWLVTSKVN